MRYVVIVLMLAFAGSLYAQETFTVDDFSDKVFAKVFISKPDEVFSEGWIAIIDKKTKRQLIKVNSSELAHTLHDGKLVSNIKELPYGEQSLILHEDFNFDGRKDLALMDGQNSCYHGPSFQIYLANGRSFRHNPEFTRLAQEYCGMFNVDEKKKLISTMTKSGCCWHQFTDFVVRNNRPVSTRIVEVGMNQNGLMWDHLEKKLVNGKWLRTDHSELDEETQAEATFFSFEFDNKKKMRLMKRDNTLIYVFTDKDAKVELLHLGPFYFSKDENSVWFMSGRTRYQISSDGTLVTSKKVSANMKAAQETVQGSLSELQNIRFENVSYQ